MIEIIDAVMTSAQLVDDYAMQGEYFEILEAQYPVDVYLLDRSGVQLSVMRRSEASFFARPGRFEHIRIESAQPQTVRFMVGSGDVGTRRISSSVSVIDGSRARVTAQTAFATAITTNAVAAQNPFAQLWNPPGSGRRLVVNKVNVSASTSCGVYVYGTNAAMATSAAASVGNKLIGAGVGVGVPRVDSSAAAPPFTFGYLNQLGAQPGVTNFWTPTEAVVINPGFGLAVFGAVQNVAMVTGFEWFEEVI